MAGSEEVLCESLGALMSVDLPGGTPSIEEGLGVCVEEFPVAPPAVDNG